ncbi:MAG: class II histone deacetylase [Halobacteriales archaeon]
MTARSLTAFFHDSFIAHEHPAGEGMFEWSGRLAYRQPHPDRPERIKNVYRIVQTELDEYVTWADVDPAPESQLHRVHTPEHVAEIEEFCAAGGGRLTSDTGANEHTYRAARHAAGAACAAAIHACETDPADVPYAMVRPGGHHAQPAQVDGFCYFNNAAVAAEHAIATDRADRVAILDWDVHHGNGTQECFYDRDDVLVISLHNDHWSWDPDTHPQTGDLDEHGSGAGEGYNLNIPLPPGTGDDGYALVMSDLIEPVIAAYDPDLLLVSAGQDPGIVDPQGRNTVSKAGFESLGQWAYDLAADYADGRLALLQEGGYHLSHLAYATLGVLEGALGIDTGIVDRAAWLDEDLDSAREAVTEAIVHHARAWPLEVTD